KPRVGIRKSDTNLGPTRVWVENIADKKELTLENLARIGSEDYIGRLSLNYQGGILFRNIRRDPDDFQISDGHHRDRDVVDVSSWVQLHIDHAPRRQSFQGQARPSVLIGGYAHRAEALLSASQFGFGLSVIVLSQFAILDRGGARLFQAQHTIERLLRKLLQG